MVSFSINYTPEIGWLGFCDTFNMGFGLVTSYDDNVKSYN